MTGWWNIPNYTFFPNSADSDLLVCFRDGLSLYLPPASERCPLWFFFVFLLFLSFSWMSVWISFLPCWRCFKSDASSIWRHTHRERLAPHAVFNLPLSLPHTTAHRGTSTLQDWGEGGGGGQTLLCQHWLKLLSITHEQSSLCFSFFFWLLWILNPAFLSLPSDRTRAGLTLTWWRTDIQ